MKKQLLLLILFSFTFTITNGQVLNQAANWPNNQWSLSGSYDAAFLFENPTITSGSSSFSFDDNLAGGTSINTIATESPVIDLSAAFNADETEITVFFNYVFNIFQTETLRLQYWDNTNSQWINWGNSLADNSGTQVNFCDGNFSSFNSSALDISAFTAVQLQGFRYRILFDDNNSFGWGFCVNSVAIASASPPACPNVNAMTISNISPTGAMINWAAGGSETSWEAVIQLSTEGVPASGDTTTNTTFSVTDLIPETNYSAYVRAICATEVFSN